MIIGILFLGLGLLFFYLIVRGKAAIKSVAIIMDFYFTVSGVLIIAAFLSQNISLQWFFLFSCSGGFCILVGCYNCQRKMFSCKEETEALYSGRSSYYGNAAVTRYSPIFQYEFQGQKYEGQSGETFSERQIEKKFQIGKTYTIYLDKKQPCSFVTLRRLQGSDIFLIVIGILILSVGIGIIGGQFTI